MPSIIMAWNGQCPDHSVQRQLNRRMVELAKITAEKYETRYDRVDGEISGNIVLFKNVFGDRREPSALVRHETNADFYRLEKARLFGVVFRLPTIYRDNRVSFIFLRADDEPGIDGYLVQTYDRTQCQEYRDPEIQAADWLLTAPSIHLRYAFEDWVTDLLAWVRIAYMPDLSYSEFDHLDGESRYLYGYHESHRDWYFQRLKKWLP